MFKGLSKSSSQGGRIEGTYIESDKSKEMKEYAESRKANNKK